MKKLHYVEQIADRLGREPAPVQLVEKDLDVNEMDETVLDHYRQRALEEKVDIQLREHLDQELCELFELPGSAPAKAEMLLRAERESLIQTR